MQITLPIFHHNDTTDTLKDCGIEYDLKDTDTRKVTFLTINAVSPYFDNDDEMTSIHSNGTEYICPYTIDKVLELING